MDQSLKVGSVSHKEQTGKIIASFENSLSLTLMGWGHSKKPNMSDWLNIPFYGALLGFLYHRAIAYLLTQWREEDLNYGYAIL